MTLYPRWNPSNPDVAGDEWYGVRPGVMPLSQGRGVGAKLTATANEGIDTLWTILRGSGTPTSFGGGLFTVDVYDLADPYVDPQEWVMAVPVANFANDSGWEEQTAGVPAPYDPTAYTFVDTVIATTTPINTGASTQLVYPGKTPGYVAELLMLAGNATFYDGDSGAGGSSITGKRVCWTEVVAVVENRSQLPVTFDAFLDLTGLRVSSDTGPQTVPAHSGLRRVRFGFFWNPVIGAPWSNADAVALTDGTNAYGLGLITKNSLTGSPNGEFGVTSMLLQFRMTTERRLVTGYGVGVPGIDAWTPFLCLDPLDPSTQAAWSKVSGHDYAILFSQGALPFVASGLIVDTGNVLGHEGDELTDSRICAVPFGNGAVPNGAESEALGEFATLLTVGGTPSGDSLPYGDALLFRCGASYPTLTQIISTESAQSYQTATIVVAADPDGLGGVLQDQPMTVTLKAVAGGGTLAGPVTINPGDVPPDGKFHALVARFSAGAALGSGQAVYIECASSSTIGWPMPGMLSRTVNMDPTDAESLVAAEVGVGGTADYGNSDTTLDFPWAIGLVPSPPGGMAQVQSCFPNQPALAYEGILHGINPSMPTEVCSAFVTWTATGLGGAFGYYELQRGEGAGPTWNTIAKIRDEASAYFYDFECPRNIPYGYQLRVVRADGGQSDWVNVGAPITILTEHLQDVVCASNWNPAASLAFQDLGGVRAWAPRQAKAPVIKDIYGRDDPVAFFGPEDGGVEFSRDLAVAFNDQAVVVGGAVQPDFTVFAFAFALLHDRTLPYVAFCDAYGNHWFASPAITNPRRTEPGGQYVATVVFTQVASVPAPWDGTVPPIP